MAARVPRVGWRGLVGPAAEQVVKAHDSERKRSGFREPRREKRSSRQTVSQVGGSPFVGASRPFYDAQTYVLCPCLTRPRTAASL